MISTAPLAILVIDGGVTRVRLSIVGCIENGLTPLPGVSARIYKDIAGKNVLNTLCRTGTDVHLNLDYIFHLGSRIRSWQSVIETICAVVRGERVSVGDGSGVDSSWRGERRFVI